MIFLQTLHVENIKKSKQHKLAEKHGDCLEKLKLKHNCFNYGGSQRQDN